MASRSVSLAFAVALALATVPALAAGPAAAAPTTAQRETARRLMDEGKEHARAGEKESAVEAYQKAHDIMKVPTTGLALAKAQLALGHLVEAREVALEVVRHPRDPAEPPVFDRARKDAKELEISLKPRIPTVRIVIKGGPATRVTSDDVEIAPLLLTEPVAMNPGRHTVVARNADGADARADVELIERDGKDLELVLPAASPIMISHPERPRGARITTSGEERTTGASVLVYGGFGLAAAGLVVGGLTGGLTLSKAGGVKAQCENDICDPAAKADLDSAASLATISTIGFAVAGGGLVLGVLGLLLPKTSVESARHSSERRAAIWLGPGSAGVRGSF